tara:strand:- start:315 stop:1742 length:1428 start_codon:yes stop_codon:yes gene_type:complete
MENSKCVYTFIVGGYDNLKQPNIITTDWDYICVTDNPNLKSDIWQIIQIDNIDKQLEPAKRRAMSLMIGHRKYLPKHYDVVVTIGGQCVINIDLNELLVKYGYDDSYDACLCEHPNRSCVYDEANTIVQVQRDTPERVDKHIEMYIDLGYPKNNGLYTSGMMIINNNSENIHKYYDQWLSDYQSFPSVRDQMTMNYSEWKLHKDTGIKLKLKLLHFQNMFERDRDIYTENHQQSHSHAIKVPAKMKVIYRISDAGYKKEKPDYINNEACLANATKVFNGTDWSIIADNVSKETSDMIEKYKPKDHTLYASEGNGAATFNLALDEALTYNDDDIVYFIENDYIHKPESAKIMQEGFGLGASFVALYDHPDKYLDPSKGGNPYCEGGGEDTRVHLTDSCHWKITNSTTMTFAAKVSTLKRVEPILRKHTSGTHPDDFQMFLELRQQGELLITPLPGYATHGETAWLSPLTDWNACIV